MIYLSINTGNKQQHIAFKPETAQTPPTTQHYHGS